MMIVTFESADSHVSFEYPEIVTHRVKGVDYKLDLRRVVEAGFRALLKKSLRQISDGSPDGKTVLRKIDQLYGEGKPIGSRVTRSPLASELVTLVVAKLTSNGLKAKDVPKLGYTVEDITSVARKHGVSPAWLKKATKRASDIAALKTAEIE